MYHTSTYQQNDDYFQRSRSVVGCWDRLTVFQSYVPLGSQQTRLQDILHHYLNEGSVESFWSFYQLQKFLNLEKVSDFSFIN